MTKATSLPQVFFGLHMSEGVAEYRPKDEKPYRVFIGESTIKNMDRSFSGRPVFVGHRADFEVEKLKEEADGYVIRSFFNKNDGKHWSEFLVVTDEAKEAITKKGWRLSNSYIIKGVANGGRWHGVDFAKTVTDAEYDHLAIVPDPRYSESMIMTPDQFKAYNLEKEADLVRLSNEKEKENEVIESPKTGSEGMLNLFKRTKVENAADLESTMVLLPKSKKEMTIVQVVNGLDDMMMEKAAEPAPMEAGKAMVKVGEKEMTLDDLVAEYLKLCTTSTMADPPKAPVTTPVIENEEDKKKKMDEDAKAKADDEAKKKVENSNFQKLDNAQSSATAKQVTIETSSDKIARGASRYGSK